MAKKSKTTKKPTEDKPTSGTANKIQRVLGKRLRIKHRSKKQKEFTDLIADKEIVLAAGPAGTGKSYLSIGKALELIQNKTNKYEYLKIVKPAVEAEEKLGFLPGDVYEKLEPHLASSMDVVDKIIGEGNRKKLQEDGVICVEPLGFVRGKTIDNTILVVEEAQNASPSQLKTLLTRIGEDTKYIISGDLDQSDRYKKVTLTGLYDVFQRHSHMEEIGAFIFEKSDIVRNPIIGKLLNNYHTTEDFMDANLLPDNKNNEKSEE
jgi:phosphate starvation-inducible protein PhoH and related proteins